MSIKARPTQRLQLLALNVIVDQVLNRSEMGFETDIAKAIADLVDKTRFERLPAVKKEIRYTVFLYPSFQLLQGRRGGRRGRRRGRESGMSLVTFIAKKILWHTLTSVQQHIFEPILKRARVQHIYRGDERFFHPCRPRGPDSTRNRRHGEDYHILFTSFKEWSDTMSFSHRTSNITYTSGYVVLNVKH